MSIVAVLLAVITGFILTLNGLVMRHYVGHLKISPILLNSDGGLLQTFHSSFTFIKKYTDLAEAIATSFISILASVVVSHAFAIGLGGPV